MNFDYNEALRSRLYALQNTLGLSDFNFEVDSEQAFLKKKDLEPNTIYVLTKALQNDNSIGVDTQPLQIMILTEQNSLDVAKAFFSEFAKKYNFESFMQTYDVTHTIWVKQQYSDPVVLSNFNTVQYGYRSVLYMSAVLYIMYDVVDLHDLYIDQIEYKPLTWNIVYSMSPNTQQVQSEYISKSVKSVSTMAITITIPVVESDLITKILKIMDENDSSSTDLSDPLSYGGNENFYFSFYLGSAKFVDKKFKLTSADFGSAINQAPVIRLGFMK